MMTGSNRLLAIAAVVLCGCGAEDSAEWGGTARDSAGVMLVGNPVEGDWTLASSPSLVEELRIGVIEGDVAYRFGAVTAIDVDDAGRIYVVDQQAAEVRVFDADGLHIRTVGRPGQGPGELSPAAAAVVAGSNDVIHVADLGRQRIVTFGADGRELRSLQLPALLSGIPMRWQVTPERGLVAQTRVLDIPGMTEGGPQRDYIIARDLVSETADTLLELRSPESVSVSAAGAVRLRFLEPEPLWTMLDDGRIAHARTNEYRIEIVGRDGKLERVISRPATAVRLTEEDRAKVVEMFARSVEAVSAGAVGGAAAVQQLMQAVEVADELPLMAAMLPGPDGTLWVQRVRPLSEAHGANQQFSGDLSDLSSSVWDVFDREGRLLGPIALPERFLPMRVVGNHVYGVHRDDLDVQRIVRLRVTGGASD